VECGRGNVVFSEQLESRIKLVSAVAHKARVIIQHTPWLKHNHYIPSARYAFISHFNFTFSI